MLAADMRALEWLAVAEMFFVPPGFTANFMYELHDAVRRLDFVREALHGSFPPQDA
jgi:hypothetical protein